MISISGGANGDEESTKISWGKPISNLCLGISMKAHHFTLGEIPIRMQIFILNTGVNEVEFYESHILRDYEIELRRDSRPVPFTTLGERVRESVMAGVHRRIQLRLKPGKLHALDTDVPLAEWFRVDQPGLYTAQVRWKGWQGSQDLPTSGLLSFECHSS